jgi:hypothetical protein
MLKFFCSIYAFYFLSLASTVLSQNYRYIPYIGGKYIEEGITFDDLELNIDENTWVSNKIPINKKFEIRIENPKGYLVENGLCFPGIAVLIKNSKNDTLANLPNLYEGNTDGLEYLYLNNLKVNLGFNEAAKIGDTLQVNVTFFDTKSTNKTTFELNVIIVDSKLALNKSTSSFLHKSYTGYKVNSSIEFDGVKTNDSIVDIDTLKIMRVKEIRMEKLKFSKMKASLTIYDSQLNIIDPNKASGSINMEKQFNDMENKLDIIFTINKLTAQPNEKFWMYRFENLETNEVIEVFNKF